ncbi:hypothetical protein K8353_42505, partial [Burkholderia contaminans]|nr:hypothetical protein [Burkholderia contaminans]
LAKRTCWSKGLVTKSSAPILIAMTISIAWSLEERNMIVATPADAALMMQLGAEGVFVGSGIFKSGDPVKRASAIVKAVTNFRNPQILAQISEDLGEAMVGINENEIQILMAERGK